MRCFELVEQLHTFAKPILGQLSDLGSGLQETALTWADKGVFFLQTSTMLNAVLPEQHSVKKQIALA